MLIPLGSYLQGCHILEKSWIFLLSWKVLENIWEVSRASPGQNSEATYPVSHKRWLEGITTGTI